MSIGQEEIGRRIAAAREKAGLSQRELAEKIGVADAQSISRYERGVTEVKTRRLERIAEATQQPLSFFVRELPAEANGNQGGDVVPPDLTELLDEIRSSRTLLEAVLERISTLERELQEERARRGEPPAQA